MGVNQNIRFMLPSLLQKKFLVIAVAGFLANITIAIVYMARNSIYNPIDLLSDVISKHNNIVSRYIFRTATSLTFPICLSIFGSGNSTPRAKLGYVLLFLFVAASGGAPLYLHFNNPPNLSISGLHVLVFTVLSFALVITADQDQPILCYCLYSVICVTAAFSHPFFPKFKVIFSAISS
eukprot:c7482_g1_i1.p1 GENE.c7482_g1_i1~~c7482_g1_i1.p1  ORF type:complete len:179 (-),score=20.61 c7482_g1_i1:345-881(-)